MRYLRTLVTISLFTTMLMSFSYLLGKVFGVNWIIIALAINILLTAENRLTLARAIIVLWRKINETNE